MKCTHKPTEWEYKFYGQCGACYIQSNWLKPKPTHGAWSRTANLEKDTHAKDILQPLKKDGTINKHFVSVHGTHSIKKELKISDKEIRTSIEKYG